MKGKLGYIVCLAREFGGFDRTVLMCGYDLANYGSRVCMKGDEDHYRGIGQMAFQSGR